MSKLEKAYLKLQELEMRDSTSPAPVDSRFSVIVILLYLCVMLSVPLGHLSMIIWYALIPILLSTFYGLSFSKIFTHSLYILPVLILIAVFNPLLDRETAITVGNITISRGWISFLSIIIRGMLAVQAMFILIEANGFIGICRSLRRLGVPSFLADQLLFVFRYLGILMQEAITMRRAREARGYGRKKYPIKIWGVMIGQLFIRSIERAERINRAMEARGFTGQMPVYRISEKSPGIRGWLFLIVFSAAILTMRFYNLSSIFNIS